MKAAAPAPGQVRIIGGRWRGTRLPVLARAGVRPSGDRVRETLFNWLTPFIDGARCLDLFAGTGVLGLEALSRGAAAVTLIERDAALVAALQSACARLGATAAEIVQADALNWLAGAARGYDLVFVDPPFDAPVATRILETLRRGWLAPRALVYLERPRDEPLPASGWREYRVGRTRQVSYRLLEVDMAAD